MEGPLLEERAISPGYDVFDALYGSEPDILLAERGLRLIAFDRLQEEIPKSHASDSDPVTVQIQEVENEV